MLSFVNEGLQQPGAIAVLTLEVRAHCPYHPPQDMRSQVAARHPGTDQKPAQSCDPVQLVAASRLVPANPGVTRLQLARGCGKADAAQPAVRGPHQIAQLRPHPRTRPARMLVCHQRVPEQALRVAFHPHQFQVLDRAHLRRYRVRRRHWLRQQPRLGAPTAPAPAPWQRNLAGCLQFDQRLTATGALQAAAAIAEPERFAYAVGNPPDALDAARRSAVQHRAQTAEIGAQGARYLTLHLHTGYGSQATWKSPAS